MFTLNQMIKVILGTLSAGAMLTSQAQLSQIPLLTQSGSVEPNLVLMFDDSASMPSQFVYQYGGSEGVYGRDGPNSNSNTATCPATLSITTTCAYNAPSSTEYYQLSPDVNRLAYDPRIRYRQRIDSVGGLAAAGTPTTTTFYVYFYKNGSNANVVWPGTNPATTTYPSVTLSTSYFSGSTYIPAASLLISGATTGLAYPTAIATGTGAFPRFVNRTDCNGGAVTGGSCSLTEERQNYANYLRYHNNRLDLAKTGLGYAFQDLSATLRLGWGLINTLDGGTLDSGVSLYDAARKAAFYTWLYARTGTVPGTPSRLALKTVGNYFSRADNSGPWANTPVTTSTGSTTLGTSGTDTTAIRAAHYSCRRNYAMLVTDGYYNDSTASVGVGNVDSTSISAITGTTASGTATTPFTYNGTTKPYPGGGTDTMADVAMKYWITDLRSDLTNNVKVIPDSVVGGVTVKGNESFWQNMGFYGVALGLNGTANLPQTASTLADLTSGAKSWSTAVGNQEEAVDDMWHATINARGRLLSAKNADELSDAVEGMLAEINKVSSSQSGVAASTASLISGTRKYTPKYTTGSWIGNVIATNLDPGSAVDISTAWQVVGTDPVTGITYNGIPAFGSRSIYAWNGSTFGSFDSSNSYITSNIVGGSSTNLINYLRGDQSNEDTASATKLYRAREALLGDIVNSTPTFIQGALDMSYDKLPAGTYGQSTYRAFVTAKAARTEGVLFAGANDGMLHGFRNSTGAEVFAFVPRAVMPNMHLLAGRSYNHTYYVDGTTVEADACLTGGSACTTWTNLLLGSLGAGGKSVFALDVTTPMSMTAASIKWEITTATTGYANLGNILSDIQTGVTTGGQWVAVFGNGYYGTDGVAHLYVADLTTGALLKDITTGVGINNGLSGPTLVRDANQRIIGAYAGDLKGNMWKFDLSGASAANWGLGLSGSPLYAATSTKPITAPPAIVTHPSGGRVVAFGTGKFFDTTDTAAGNAQALYGVWDSVAFGYPIPSTPAGVTQTGVTNLVQQTVSAATTGTFVKTNSDLSTTTTSFTGYVQSKNTIDWTTKRGWYLNLTNTGERMVYPMANLIGRLFAAFTLAPTSSVLDPCTQAQSAKAWGYVMDMLTGSRPDDSIYAGCPNCNVIGPVDTSGPPTIITGQKSADGKTQSFFPLTPTGTAPLPPITSKCGSQTFACPATTSVVKRTWRQLFLR